MTKLILIRHGEPELPAEKSYIGVTDLPMSEREKNRYGRQRSGLRKTSKRFR